MTTCNGGRNGWYTLGWKENSIVWKCNQPAKYVNKNFLEECEKTLQLMVNDWSGPIPYLSLTGGMDSELVGNCLIRLGVDFKVIMIDVAGYNQQEQTYAYRWCQQNNIVPIVKTFTVAELVEISKYYLKDLIKVKNLMLSPILWMLDWVLSQKGYLIYSDGDAGYDYTQKNFYYQSMDYIIDFTRNGKHPSNVFMYTPELAASFASQINPDISIQYNKFNFYQIPTRPKMGYINPWSKDKEYNEKFLGRAWHITNGTCYCDTTWLGSKEQWLSQLLE